MIPFRCNSLQSRLILLGTLSVTIALVTACLGFLWSDLRSLHEAKRRQLQAQSEIVGFNSAAALLIGDAHAGREILAPLAAQSTIAAGAIYSEDGTVLSEFAAENAVPAPRTAPGVTGHIVNAAGELEYVQVLEEGGQRIGHLYLRANMQDLRQQIKEHLLVSLFVVAASLAAALPLAYALARTISRPILELARTADHITRQGDFTIRVASSSQSEIGTLYRAFNAMLQQVDSSDRALKASQDKLEERVDLRTSQLQEEIRERERIQHDLIFAKDAAEAASRAKSEFLANMSHEIRTPMNGVLGLTELILDTELSPEQRESMEMVKSSGDALMIVINDILDFSKIEAGRLELDPIDFLLSDLLDDTLKSLALRAHRKGLELSCDLHHDVPLHVTGDSGRLRQVLVNLVGNAIKFTEQGEITVCAELVGQSSTDLQVRFAVTDTGIGIRAEKQQLIFEAFSQADGSTTRKYGGTGLGLTISHQLVELMGGELRVESVAGQGSKFYFDVPFGVPTGVLSPGDYPVPVDLEGLAVLIVDDNATNRRILEGTLRKWGARPTAVDSGSAALAELQRAALAGSPFPLLLVDAMMPEMDGFGLIEQLRMRPELDSPTVMMLTSADGLGDADRCRKLGLAAYLIKPVKAAELRQAVLSALQGRTIKDHRSEITTRPTALPATETQPSQHARPLRILLAEDNPVNQRVAVRTLAKHGFIVTVVGNGREALETVAQNSFDLVLMDVQMPELDGLEATRAIRMEEADSDRRLPIIAMTAHAMKGDKERCLEAGMDDYVTKPIQVQDLLRAIKAVTTPDAVSVPLANPVKLPTAARETPRADCAFHHEEALEQAGGDEGFLAELIQLFQANAPAQMNEIRAALAAGEGRRLNVAAHSLKGALGYIGARPASLAANNLERIAASSDLSTAPAAVDRLVDEMAQLSDAISKLALQPSA
jgi:two-component system sensor histidine kinase/response regulator